MDAVIADITAFVLAFAASPWIYPLTFGLTVLDAFLVVVPSETVVVSLGALAASSGQPLLWILGPVAALAAMIGDSLTFAIGRSIGGHRPRWMRRPRIAAALDWAGRALDRRAVVVLLTARFVPFGRIAVNLTAGATGFRYRRFVLLTAIAGCAWAAYNIGIGALFGRVFADVPLLAVVVSIVVAIGVGIAADAVSSRISGRRAAAAEGER
jgi:membrane-associated protein